MGAWPVRSSRSTSERSATTRGRLRELLDPAELWAVVKADGYGHGAVDVGRAALDGGARGALRRDRRRGDPLRARFPTRADRRARADAAAPTRSRARARRRSSSPVVEQRFPEDVPCAPQARHRHGALGPRRAPRSGPVGRRPHDPPRDGRHRTAFAREQLERFLEATEPYAGRYVRHAANSAAALEHARDEARRGPLRDRAVRRRPASARTQVGSGSARAALGVGARTGAAPRSRASRPGYGRRFVAESTRPGSGSSRWDTRTASGAT